MNELEKIQIGIQEQVNLDCTVLIIERLPATVLNCSISGRRKTHHASATCWGL